MNNTRPQGIISGFALLEMERQIREQMCSIDKNIKLLGTPKILVGCDHDWKQYRGFVETYEFCAKCDVKK